MSQHSHVWLDRRFYRAQKEDGDKRNDFQRDKARILHSAAFRRLQAKTQVLGVGMSDFYRTRLTHSLEVAQIGAGIGSLLRKKYPAISDALGINEHLIESLCLAHDIGHPPFGHGGEIALHYMMSEHGGFEGNAQTFRIVTKLETYSPRDGMNLARRTILGLIKYPNYIDNLINTKSIPTKSQSFSSVKADQWHPPKGLYSADSAHFDWLLKPLSAHDKETFMCFDTSTHSNFKTKYKSFDCSIMELADDIAYAIHDLEDAIAMSLVERESFEKDVISDLKEYGISEEIDDFDRLTDKLFSEIAYERKSAIGALVNYFITSIQIEKQQVFESILLDYVAYFPNDVAMSLNVFKRYIFRYVINKPELQVLRYKGQQIVMNIFEALNSEPLRFLPKNTSKRWQSANERGLGERVISDYISGMTDEYASKVYGYLFLPNHQPTLGSLNN